MDTPRPSAAAPELTTHRHGASLSSASQVSARESVSIIGRERDLDAVRSVLDRARRGLGSVLVIEGEPGIGKTTLLNAAEGLADGFTCLWAHGVEAEAVPGPGGLLEALTPVRAYSRDLPDGQADVLSSALGWGMADSRADPFLLAAATMSLLARAAEEAPVLLLVDDLHWLDHESARALLYAARRLSRDAVAVLLCVRPASGLHGTLDGLPVLSLGGLPTAGATQLLAGRVASTVVEQLVQRTGGNPLALQESVHGLTDAQRVGAEPLPDALPTGPGVLATYERVIAALSPDARTTVLLFAVAAHADDSTVLRALTERGMDVGPVVDEAEERGVLRRDGAGWRLCHPLLRTAALRLASAAERRDAHRALAGIFVGEESRSLRAWHLAEATVGSDDDLAEELTRVADERRNRRGFAAASATLERAAQLSSDPFIASDRRASAVHDAFVAGDVERVRSLATAVLDGASRPDARARVLHDLGTLEQYAGSVHRAADLLAQAAGTGEGSQRVHALAELALCRFRLNDIAGFVECADGIDTSADRSDAAQRLLADFTRGVALTLVGDYAGGQPLLTGVVDQAASPPLRDDPRNLLHLALAAAFLGDARHAMQVGAASLADARDRGAIGILVPALAITAAGRAWLGDHAGAFADAGEAVELGDWLGYTADVAVALEMLAWQSAARGLHDDAAAALVRSRMLTDRAGTTPVAAHQAVTSAFCALCRGDLTKAATILEERIEADGGVGPMGEPLGVAPFLVEAYLGVDRKADAALLASRYAEVTPASAAPASRALLARCRGMTASTADQAAAAFEDALHAHAQAPDSFEQARTRLLYGARLRRDGRRVLARDQLRAALEAFDAMGLTVWSSRATDELAASGLTARPRGPLNVEPLTPQETRVAQMVAQGMSNREAAAALFISPKTVEHHLSSVYRKQGVRSRTQLAHRLSTTKGA